MCCTRAKDNWKLLMELEKAAKVYWSAKDKLPPRVIIPSFSLKSKYQMLGFYSFDVHALIQFFISMNFLLFPSILHWRNN